MSGLVEKKKDSFLPTNHLAVWSVNPWGKNFIFFLCFI